jgi:hypothetical protein
MEKNLVQDMPSFARSSDETLIKGSHSENRQILVASSNSESEKHALEREKQCNQSTTDILFLLHY